MSDSRTKRYEYSLCIANKGNNKITELRTNAIILRLKLKALISLNHMYNLPFS